MSKNTVYTPETKRNAVLEYIKGNVSQLNICRKYGILSRSQLHDWVLKYNGQEGVNPPRTGGSQIMAKGRKTTFEERVEIIQYCISHNNNYIETAKKYQISYQQARNYTVK
jgi:transposase-like protein